MKPFAALLLALVTVAPGLADLPPVPPPPTELPGSESPSGLGAPASRFPGASAPTIPSGSTGPIAGADEAPRGPLDRLTGPFASAEARSDFCRQTAAYEGKSRKQIRNMVRRALYLRHGLTFRSPRAQRRPIEDELPARVGNVLAALEACGFPVPE